MIADSITAINLSGATNDPHHEYSSFADTSLIHLKLNHSLSRETVTSLQASAISKGAGH